MNRPDVEVHLHLQPGRMPGVVGRLLAAARGCLVVAAAVLPLQGFLILPVAGQRLFLADLFLVAAIALRGLAWVTGAAPVRLRAIHGGWLAYLLALGAACFVTPGLMPGAGKWVGVLYLVLIAAVTMDLAAGGGYLRRLVLAFVGGAAVAAALSIAAAVGFYVAPGSPWVASLLSHYGSLPPGPYPRTNSLFANANMFCNYLVVATVLLLAAARVGWVRAAAAKWGVAVLVLGALPTISSGLGGLALALGLWFWWTQHTRMPLASKLSLTAGVLVAAATLFAVAWVNPAGTGEPSVRWLVWQDAWRTWMLRPWLGVGLGENVTGVGLVTASGTWQWLTDAHNIWLSLAGQAGLAGVLAMLLVCVLLLRGRWPAADVADAAATLRVACAVAFIGAFLYHGMTGSFEDARHLWILMGLLAAQPYLRDIRETSSRAWFAVR